jgi:hypothetical protein
MRVTFLRINDKQFYTNPACIDGHQITILVNVTSAACFRFLHFVNGFRTRETSFRMTVFNCHVRCIKLAADWCSGNPGSSQPWQAPSNNNWTHYSPVRSFSHHLNESLLSGLFYYLSPSWFLSTLSVQGYAFFLSPHLLGRAPVQFVTRHTNNASSVIEHFSILLLLQLI